MPSAAEKQECRQLSSKGVLPSAGWQLTFWLITVAGLGADLCSKQAVFRYLAKRPIAEYDVIKGFLKLVIRENSGAAFSMAEGQTKLLTAISVIALIAVVALFVFGKIRQTIMRIALAMFTAGIAGNLYDRLFNNGMVRDFIDVYYKQWHWPAFNVADSLLCMAAGLVIIAALMYSSGRKFPR